MNNIFLEQIGGEVDTGFLLGTSPYYLHEYLSRMIKKRVGKKALRQSSKQLAILLVTLGW